MARRIRQIAGFVTILVVAAGLWTPAAAQPPIRIGVSLSLTGTYAALGQNQRSEERRVGKECRL